MSWIFHIKTDGEANCAVYGWLLILADEVGLCSRATAVLIQSEVAFVSFWVHLLGNILLGMCLGLDKNRLGSVGYNKNASVFLPQTTNSTRHILLLKFHFFQLSLSLTGRAE